MQAFIDPYPFPATDYPKKEVKYSPDNRSFAVVTQRGILSTNELEATIWIFDTGEVAHFLTGTSRAEPPKPRVAARMAAVANDSAITQLRWVTDTELAFLGRDKNSNRSLFTTDVATNTLKKLTPDGHDVTGFDIVSSTIVYTAAQHRDAVKVPTVRVVTGHSLSALVEPEEGPDFVTYGGKPADLWLIRNNKASPVLDRTTGKPVQLITSLLSLSPSEHSVVITQYADWIPKAWESYETIPNCVDCKRFRLKASPPESTRTDSVFFFNNPKQYALVDLDSGKINPINAPLGLTLQYAGPEEAIWSQDGQKVYLVNTFLPLDNVDESEWQRRITKPCVALFDVISGRSTCLAAINPINRAEYVNSGTTFFLRDVQWNEAAKELTLSYETFGNENDPAHHEHAPEVYRQEKNQWVLEDKPLLRDAVAVRVEVRQDLNEPPALFARLPNEDNARKLWDPNPELKDVDLGEVSVYQWKDNDGHEWTGGLVKPPTYVLGHRYPLVIQTHGFNQHEFMTVGAFTTVFAARPIAATGMVVLQVDDKFDLQGSQDEALIHVSGYEAAIERLTNEGLVDSHRVGLIGFSRTGYYTLEALTMTAQLFAAATIADSDYLGYMQRLLEVDGDSRDSFTQEGIRIFGSQPFGTGLRTWMEKAPAFNLDKVRAPVRIEVHDLNSLLSGWEVYAGLRLLEKPVDMIQLPDACHVVVKPVERFASEQGDVDWFDFWLNGHEDPNPTKAEQYTRWRLLRERREENMRSSK